MEKVSKRRLPYNLEIVRDDDYNTEILIQSGKREKKRKDWEVFKWFRQNVIEIKLKINATLYCSHSAYTHTDSFCTHILKIEFCS